MKHLLKNQEDVKMVSRFFQNSSFIFPLLKWAFLRSAAVSSIFLESKPKKKESGSSTEDVTGQRSSMMGRTSVRSKTGLSERAGKRRNERSKRQERFKNGNIIVIFEREFQILFSVRISQTG